MSASATGSTIYNRLGMRTVVNCQGIYSELGGAIIGPTVWEGMTEANSLAVSMSELLQTTGRRIAEILGAEDARVTPGAAAAIALGTAACMTRGDGAAAERLPDTAGLPSEVLIQRVQAPTYKYGRMVWMTGARLRQIGSETGTTAAELSAALDPERVAAVIVPAHLDQAPGALPLREVAAAAHERGIPTLVDAAFLNYPPDSMSRFTEEGADLVCFSAKYFYGPNGGGFIVGRSDLIGNVELVDFTGFESGQWLIFGRPFKLDRHTVVGTLLALEEWVEMDHPARWHSYAELVAELKAAVAGIRGVDAAPRFFTMEETLENEPINCLLIRIDAAKSGVTAADVERTLHDSNPRVAVHQWDDTLLVAVDAMLPEQVGYVCGRLQAAFQ
jgi:D-glucosaminate-6-phosphate ammonia-lyase